MNRSILMVSTTLALSLGMAAAAFAQTTGGSGNLGSGNGNASALASYNNLAVDLSTNLSSNKSSSKTINTNLSSDTTVNKSSTANVAKDNVTVGGNFSISTPAAKTDQDLKGVVVNDTFNLEPAQAAAAAGGSGLVSGGGAAAGSSGAQPIYTGSIDVSGAAMQNFAGIQTASFQTGIGSNALAASGVTANSSVTFGSSHAGP